jgi:cation:H+ antiporter
MNPELGRILAIDLPLIVLSIALLWKGADFLVESASRIGKQLGLSELVIGLTIVAFGTSAPEFAVTVQAALAGRSDISVGNVVGSNIFNLGFVLGGVALIKAIGTNRPVVYRDGFFLIFVTLLLRVFIADQSLSTLEGASMLALLAAYLLLLFYQRDPLNDGEEEIEGKATRRDWLILLGSLVAVVGGGHLLVESASAVARAFGVSDWVIGVTIVAAGTSAPELATSLVAALRGHQGLSIGNLLGSDIFNLLGVLGTAAVLNPHMTVDADALGSVSLLVLMVCVVVFFLRTGWRLSRTEGFLLVAVNALRWYADFNPNIHLRLPW